MNIVIEPGLLRGRVTAPASKSMAHRVLIAAALSDRPTRVRIDTLNDDIEATMDGLAALGAGVGRDAPNGWLTTRPIESASGARAVDCGESGSTLRFLLPVACALGVRARFSGRGRLPERPMKALTDALRAHGAEIDSDRLPMNVGGGLTGGLWTLPGNVSSQYVTGLMLALPLLHEDSEIRLTSPLQSASYVDMTRRALEGFGIAVMPERDGWRVPGGQRYRSPGEAAVEGDWSAAAFWFAANAMGSRIDVAGLDPDSAQGDRRVSALLDMTDFDARDVPDLVPALAAAAATRPADTTIRGVGRLRLKESDRLKATADMIEALGGAVSVVGDDVMVVHGGRPLSGGAVDGCSDHRIVMAAAILATRASGPVTITGAEAVSKSYPDFFDHFRALGGIAREQYAGE